MKKGITYPRWRYHKDHGSVIVQNQEEDSLLWNDWSDCYSVINKNPSVDDDLMRPRPFSAVVSEIGPGPTIKDRRRNRSIYDQKEESL